MHSPFLFLSLSPSLSFSLSREDATHFEVPSPDFPQLQELQDDISRYETTWSLYEEYTNKLNEMTTQDWISFRYRVLGTYCMIIF